jgi:hypothetical protein
VGHVHAAGKKPDLGFLSVILLGGFEEEKLHPYTREDDKLVESGTPLSTQIGVVSRPSTIDARPGSSASSSRPGKQPLIVSRKKGEGIDNLISYS